MPKGLDLKLVQAYTRSTDHFTMLTQNLGADQLNEVGAWDAIASLEKVKSTKFIINLKDPTDSGTTNGT